MTLKQRLFTEYYLTTGNATEAARRAGYQGDDNCIGTIASNLMNHNEEIKEAISERVELAAMEADEVLGRIAMIARSDVFDFLDLGEFGSPTINLSKGRNAGRGLCVKEIIPTRSGIRLKLHDPMTALQILAKTTGVLKDAISGEEMAAFIRSIGKSDPDGPKEPNQ